VIGVERSASTSKRNRTYESAVPMKNNEMAANCAIVKMRIGLGQKMVSTAAECQRCQHQRLPFQEMEILNRAKGQEYSLKNKAPARLGPRRSDGLIW